MEQLSIFDYISKEPSKPKTITEDCILCRHLVWLNKDGKRIRSCDCYGGCKKELKCEWREK